VSTPPDTGLRFNRVRFVLANGRSCNLALTAPWVRTCGVGPDVNVAIVLASELEAMGPVTQLNGTIEFYFKVFGVPDVRLQNHWVVDVQPEEWGIPVAEGQAKPDPLTTTPRIISYKVSFADGRENFAFPFGGHLAEGEINKEPIKIASDADGGGIVDDNGHDLINPQRLAKICLEAMGLDPAKAPNSLSDQAPIFNLEWRGSHAATELEKILVATKHAMRCKADGTIDIVRIGTGTGPSVPVDQKLAELPFQGVERRGRSVVFTSAPNAILETKTIVGPQVDASGGGVTAGGETPATDTDTWQFVILDKDRVWKPIKESSFYKTANPLDSIKKDFSDIEEKYRDLVRTTLYRCVRLNPKTFGPAPIRAEMVSNEQGNTILQVSGIEFKAKLAIRNASGIYDNSQDLIPVVVTNLLEDGRIICVAERLLQVSGATADPKTAAMEIGENDLSVRCTRERYEKDDAGRWRPKYFWVGFTQQLGRIATLDEDGVNNVLASADGVIVRRPDLRLVVIDDVEVNRGKLEDIGGGLAPAYVASGDPAKMVYAAGFVAGDTDGLVAKITYDQDKVMTAFEVATFFFPGSDYLAPTLEVGKQGAGEKFPQQAATQPTRLAAGDNGATLSSVPVMPIPLREGDPGVVKVLLKGMEQGRGKYYGGIVGGSSKADTDSAEVQPEGMINPTNSTALILNLREDKSVIFATGPDHMLPLNEYYLGKLVGGGSNGAIVEIDCDRCNTSGTTKAMIHLDTTTEAPFSDSAENGDRSLVQVSILSRMVYNAGGAKALYAYFRTLDIQCGRIASISAESQRTVFTTGPCP
jgi:hypothetical protein